MGVFDMREPGAAARRPLARPSGAAGASGCSDLRAPVHGVHGQPLARYRLQPFAARPAPWLRIGIANESAKVMDEYQLIQ